MDRYYPLDCKSVSIYCSAGDGNPAITQDSIIGGLLSLLFIHTIYYPNGNIQAQNIVAYMRLFNYLLLLQSFCATK